MKNLMLLIVTLLATFTIQAAEYPNIIVNKNKSFVLDINDWKMKNIEVSILDNFNRIVYNEAISAGYNKVKKYDLAGLSAGLYTVKIEDDLKEIFYTVLVNSTSIALMSDKTIAYKPIVVAKGDKVDINVLALNKAVAVDLFDVEGTNLFSESQKDKGKYARRLDISTLPSGYYTLQVKFNDQLYTHSISK